MRARILTEIGAWFRFPALDSSNSLGRLKIARELRQSQPPYLSVPHQH